MIDEGVLVKPIYRPHFVHDLNLASIDISSGDFPIEKLSNAIIRSSMIDYAIWSYKEERSKLSADPISAWFCADVSVAEATLSALNVASATLTSAQNQADIGSAESFDRSSL